MYFFLLAGVTFLKVNSLDSNTGKWRDSDSRAIDAMVGIMGGVGFTFLLAKLILTCIMTQYYKGTAIKTYLIYTSVKNSSRIVGILFQFYLFMRVSIHVFSKKANRSEALNNFLMPVLLIVQISIFLTAVVDLHHNEVEKILAKSDLDVSVQFFLDVGAPIYLGFCLHMALHFSIIQHGLCTKKPLKSCHPEETGLMTEDEQNSEVFGTFPPSSETI